MKKRKSNIELQYEEAMRAKCMSPKTISTYGRFFEKYIRWLRDDSGGKWVHPDSAGSEHLKRYLTQMATRGNYSASSQNTCLAALLFYYNTMLCRDLQGIDAVRAIKPKHLPVCASLSDFAAMLDHLHGVARLVAMLQFGSGLRIAEACSLRIKDIDLDRNEIFVRRGKGNKDRVTIFDPCLREPLQRQIESMRVLWKSDRADNLAGVTLPGAYHLKAPSAEYDWRWFYLFAADNFSRLSTYRNNGLFRHHRHQDPIAATIAKSAKQAGIVKRITSHSLRHGFATELLRQKTDLRTIQKLMGHAKIETTMIYLHVDLDDVAVSSPLAGIIKPNSRELAIA